MGGAGSVDRKNRIVSAVVLLALAFTVLWANDASAAEWKQQSAPSPVEGVAAKFDDVSCLSASACVAVGQVEAPESKFSAFAERWNGTTWSTQEVAGTMSFLEGVSCVTANDCTAVGWTLTKSPIKQTAGVEHWNGTSWSYQAVPLPAGAQSSVLHDVSCDNTGQCTAVGLYLSSTFQRLPLIERYSGGSWTVQTAAVPAETSYAELTDVWCGHWVVSGLQKNLCTTVGVSEKGP